MGRIREVSQYIDQKPAEARRLLTKIRTIIHRAEPGIEESFQWGAPNFNKDGQRVVFIFTAKRWVSVHFVIGAHIKDSHRAFNDGFDNKNGRAIKIAYGEEVPEPAIADYVQASIKAYAAGTKFQQEKRPEQPMPSDVRDELVASGVQEIYESRPPYQRRDYLMWIAQAKREETRRKRLAQMIAELEAGEYMGTPYRGKP